MDAGDVNGGNAEVAREDSNLETIANMPDLLEMQEEQTVKMEVQELNGDVKGSPKKTTPNVRRKLRKFKANSTSSVETDESPKSRGIKRKLSEPDDVSSEESMEFNGFDIKNPDEIGAGTNILRKLIAEAEEAEAMMAKRVRYSTPRKNTETSEKKEEDQDFDDDKAQFSETEAFDPDKIKKEKESDKSETESVGMPNSVDSEVEASKAEESSHKSANSSATSSPSAMSQKSKSSRSFRNASPATLKQKALDHMSNPAFKEPFKYGWKRELVFRGTTDSSLKRMADVYYYSPKGKKLRSLREVAEFLNTKELTIDNFTYFKEPIGMDDPEKEIIRDARKVGRSVGATPTPPKKAIFGKKTPGRKATPVRKPTPLKKAIEEPSTPQTPPTTASTTTPVPASSPGTVASTPVSAKTTIKSPKTRSAFKIKMSAKKTPQIKMKSADESEMLPPQKSPANTRRNPVQILQSTEKSTPLKAKRLLAPKVQEPCSIRCSTSMGLIPSLQCRICLCLYHPECVGGTELTSNDDYVCKNCRQESNDAQQNQSMNPSLTPPPLIPISMIGSQGTKPKHQVNLTPPKLQRIPKSDGTESPTRNSSKHSKASMVSYSSPTVDKREGTWFAQAENEFLQSPDGTIPKPAQNIAVMAGKRYIVVPKNNAMAVQPAITVKPDKIGDKPPILQDGALVDVPDAIENSTDPVSKNSGIKEVVDKTTDKEVQKDVSFSLPISAASTQTVNEILHDDSANTDAVDISVVENESSAVTIPIETNNDTDHKVIEEVPNTTLPQNNINVDCTNSTVNKAELQEPISVMHGITQAINKRKQNQQEIDQKQHFMESVSAGYHALLRIFQYLKVQELLRAARVSKMWRDLAAHPSLWKTVRMKNSQVTDWDGLADTLQRRGTQYLDLRKMLVAGESDNIWRKFLSVIPRVTSLVKLELCRCPAMVVEEVIKSCPQFEVLSAMSIKCDSLNLESVGNLKRCQELRLKAISGMSLQDDLSPLQDLGQLTQLSLTSVKELGKKKIDVIQTLVNLETLELGECSDFPDKFGTSILIKLQKLERLRLEKGQGSCCTFDILEGVSKLENLSQLELVNFDVKNGFDKCLANCKNIKRLLIIPTYISQSATSNNMVLGGVTELSNNLTHFVWGVTLELLRVTELFVDQCNLMNKQVTGDSIPVLKPVPCLKLIEDIEDENDNQKGDDQQPNVTSPQVDILPLPQLQKLLLTALPKTRVKILKIPFHATWRQSISDTATQ